MWPYKIHSEEAYYKAIEFVENYAVSLRAEFIGTREQTFTTISGDMTIKETLEMKVFKFGDEYFWVEHHYLPECPFIVFSFGSSMDDIVDDADPFPYNLEEDELMAEVRYSLGLEDYPE